MNTLKAKLSHYRKRLFMAWSLISMLVVLAIPASAQSVSITITPADLDVFFTWFNTMFSTILPIALIGAGLVAGAAFAFVVGNMLKKAFQSLAGGGAK